MDINQLAYIWLCFMAYCFVGWVFESIYCSIMERKLINRGFLNGPYIPIYGAGAMLAVGTLYGIQNPVILFLLGMAGCMALEYLTSYVMERLFHARWWDYENMPLNINGRVCVPAGLLFGAGCLAACKVVQPWLGDTIDAMPTTVCVAIAAVLFVMFWADFAFTCAGLANFKAKLDDLRKSATGRADVLVHTAANMVLAEDVHGKAAHWKDRATTGALVLFARATLPLRYSAEYARKLAERFGFELPTVEDAYNLFAESLNRQERRVMAAFPKMKTVRPQHLRTIAGELMARIFKQ